jgi:hypothetical protein
MNRWDLAQFLAFVGLLGMVLGTPFLLDPARADDLLIRWTVRLSLAYWTIAVSTFLLGGTAYQARLGGWPRFGRWCWSFAWASYLIHLAVAFHFYHHWSHHHALEHTREVSGSGEGIFVSHLFTIVWTLDVLWWWAAPGMYMRRPVWVGLLLHGFMAFIIFNGTVVYETGMIRWAGLAMFVWLGALALIRAFERVTLMRRIDQPR